jgi:hypothetical protein
VIGTLLRLAGVNGIAVPVVRGNALEDEVPWLWIAVQQALTFATCLAGRERRWSDAVDA